MSDVRRARIAISVVFAVHGGVTGSFASRVPWIAERLHTDPGGLGVALLFGSFGALTAMPFSGRITRRFRVRPTIAVLITLWTLALIPTALAANLPALCAAMFCYGATAGLADVAMNAQGVVVEQRTGRSIMSGLHGMWSIGGLLGSGAGILAAHTGLDARVHFAIATAVLAVAALAVTPLLLDVAPPQGDGPSFALPPRPVLLIALVAFCAVFGELACADWAAVYLTDVASAGPALAAGAVSGFAAMMAAARLAGDRVVDRFGPARTVRLGGAVATAGAVVVALARQPVLAIGGFALIGLGVAVVVPLAFTAAGNGGPRPAQQIAGVATIAYGAGLIAPAVIGGVGHVASLSVSFVLVACLTAVVGVGAGALRRPAPVPAAGGRPGQEDALRTASPAG